MRKRAGTAKNQALCSHTRHLIRLNSYNHSDKSHVPSNPDNREAVSLNAWLALHSEENKSNDIFPGGAQSGAGHTPRPALQKEETKAGRNAPQ